MLHQQRVATALTALALTISVGLAGCTAATTSDPPVPTGSATPDLPAALEVPGLLDTNKLQLPLDSYLPTLDQVIQTGTARRVLIRRCMQRFGFSVSLPEPPAGIGLKSQNERRYGLTDPSAAAQIGYGLGARDPRKHKGGRDDASPLSAKALAVLTGEGPDIPAGLPTGGCRAEAQQQLDLVDPQGHQPVDENVPQSLSLETFERSREDPRVKAVFADWSSCMKAKQHNYPTPLDPPADPAFVEPGSAQERQTATDDVACKVSTNVIGTWFPVESAYQTMVIHQHQDELAAIQRANTVHHTFVRKTLGSHG